MPKHINDRPACIRGSVSGEFGIRDRDQIRCCTGLIDRTAVFCAVLLKNGVRDLCRCGSAFPVIDPVGNGAAILCRIAGKSTFRYRKIATDRIGNSAAEPFIRVPAFRQIDGVSGKSRAGDLQFRIIVNRPTEIRCVLFKRGVFNGEIRRCATVGIVVNSTAVSCGIFGKGAVLHHCRHAAVHFQRTAADPCDIFRKLRSGDGKRAAPLLKRPAVCGFVFMEQTAIHRDRCPVYGTDGTTGSSFAACSVGIEHTVRDRKDATVNFNGTAETVVTV